MKLTRGELRALACYTVVFVGFMPPVIIWACGVTTTVLGVPFLFFWVALMVLATSILMTLAMVITDLSDRK